MFTVVITEKGGAQRKLEFDKPEVTIGRVQGNDIILPKGNVSKRHSRIVLKDNRFIVDDLKSTNGTYVNGRKITLVRRLVQAFFVVLLLYGAFIFPHHLKSLLEPTL